mmetsp:Transcript_9377/g.22509  ORF Transcript_9377/g.22509 Transcript_9377/m.22509 type:complete len:298 (+) Transcript_9377:223-1116(+)
MLLAKARRHRRALDDLAARSEDHGDREEQVDAEQQLDRIGARRVLREVVQHHRLRRLAEHGEAQPTEAGVHHADQGVGHPRHAAEAARRAQLARAARRLEIVGVRRDEPLVEGVARHDLRRVAHRLRDGQDDDVDQKEEGDVARGARQLGYIQLGGRQPRVVPLRKPQSDGADEPRRHGDVSEDRGEGEVAEGAEEREQRDDREHERHDGRVGGARDDIGERTLDEVDVRDAHAHRREHDPEERQHGERTARRSRESRLQQLRVSETTAELARLGPLGGGEPRRGHRGQGAEREGEE